MEFALLTASAGHNGLHGISLKLQKLVQLQSCISLERPMDAPSRWYEGYLVGGHPRTSSFAEITSRLS